MIRIFGILMLSALFIVGGFILSEQFKKRHRDTLYLLGLIKHLKIEIQYTGKPLAHCLSSYPDKNNPSFIAHLAARQFDIALKELHLNSLLKEELSLFFTQLGSRDKEQEELRCQRMILRMEEEEGILRSSLSEKVRVSRTVGVCIGGVLLLLLL